MRFKSMAGVVVGIVVLVLGAGTATGGTRAPAAPPGIQIVPGPEGPDEAQFAPGDSDRRTTDCAAGH